MLFWCPFREELDKLEYLTMCIKEAIRVHNPVWSANRCMEKEVIVDGVHLPAGITVEIMLHSHHHNPDIWGDDHMVSDDRRVVRSHRY